MRISAGKPTGPMVRGLRAALGGRLRIKFSWNQANKFREPLAVVPDTLRPPLWLYWLMEEV